MKDDAAVIGDRIRLLRRSLGMTQVDFAVAIDVARSHLANVERGKAVLGLDKMIAIARGHGASLDWLIGLDDRPALDLRAAELLRAFRGMTEEAKSGLLSVIKASLPSSQGGAPPIRPFAGARPQENEAESCANVVPIRVGKPAA